MKQVGLPALAFLAFTLNGQEPAKTEPSVAPFSVTHTFTGLGTREEQSIAVDGATFVFPVDEKDVIELLRPRIAEYRKQRSVQASLEAKAIREAFSSAEVRSKLLARVASLLGAKTLTDGSAGAYDRALAEVLKLAVLWDAWSSDIETVHFFNHATATPYRIGKERIDFAEIHCHKNPQGAYGITLHPPFISKGTGIGGFNLKQENPHSFKLSIPILAAPGTSAKTIAADLSRLIDLISKLQNEFGKSGRFVILCGVQKGYGIGLGSPVAGWSPPAIQ